MLYRPKEAHYKDRFIVTSAKAKNSTYRQHGQLSLLSIPGESLTHITSYLDPASLLVLSKTCKRLHEHLEDDNTWHRAFVYQFLGIGPEAHLDDAKSLMLRRSESSWRREFVIRHNLRRRWERSRNSTITHIPHHSTISGMHQMPENTLLTSSVKYGIVARSMPLTGKVLRGYLDAFGTGLGIGNPNEEFTPNISACALSSEGGTAKVLWGFRNGQVAVMTANRAMDNARAAAKLTRCKVEEEHQGLVQAIVWDPSGSVFVSGGVDGKVKVWDTKTVKCIHTFNSKEGALVPDSCMKVSVSLDYGVVVCALKSGEIILWVGLTYAEGQDVLPHSIKEFRLLPPFPKSNASESRDTDMERLAQTFHLDFSKAGRPSILASYSNLAYFYRYSIDLQDGQVDEIIYGDSTFGPITALKAIFTSAPNESSFVITGDSLGSISIYDWNCPPVATLSGDKKQMDTSVLPLRNFEAHNDGAITSIAWNPVTLVTGSARGSVKVFDALTFAPLRSFHAPGLRPHGDAEWEPASDIILDKELLFVSIGSKVMAWKAGPVGKEKTAQKTKHASKTRRAGTAKWQEQIELSRDINESRSLLEQEQAYIQRNFGRERDQRSALNELGLDEIEAVEYVLMLSRDEERQFGPVMPLVDEGVFEGDFDEDTTGSPSQVSALHALASPPSEHPWTAPSSRRTSSGSPQMARSFPRVTPPTSFNKVQVSPPFRPEPMEAGPSITPLNISPTQLQVPSRHEFPAISASLSSSSAVSNSGSWVQRSSWGTPPSLRSWSSPGRSLPSSAVPSPGTSPMMSRAISGASSSSRQPSSSLLSAQLASHPGVSRNTSAAQVDVDDDMDDDLRHAIELSLAEAMSRGENVEL